LYQFSGPNIKKAEVINHDRNEALLKIREKIKLKAKDRRKESPTPPPIMSPQGEL